MEVQSEPQTLETKDSHSTLVDPDRQQASAPHSTEPVLPSPFTASSEATFGLFTPMASPANPFTGTQTQGAGPDGALQNWTAEVSSSLNDLASQFSVAAQRLAALPPPPTSPASASVVPSATPMAPNTQEIVPSLEVDLTPLLAAQARLEAELETLKEQVSVIGHERRRAEKEKEKERDLSDDFYREQLETRFLGIEKKLDEVAETIRIECVSMYFAPS